VEIPSKNHLWLIEALNTWIRYVVWNFQSFSVAHWVVETSSLSKNIKDVYG
jgi:hypothetical protein